MRYIFILSLLFISVGCASQSQIMVNADTGQTARCSHSGWGVYGVAVTSMNQNNCVSDYRKLGYREIEQIPMVGIGYAQQGENIHDKISDPATVISVHPNGPAFAVGIKKGDLVVAINGDPVTCIGDIMRNRYKYNIGETVTYTIKRDTSEHNFIVKLISYSELVGQVR